MNYSYTDIEQYLVNYQIDGKQIHCEFQTPNGEVYDSTAPISATKTAGSEIQKQVTRVIAQQAKRQTNRLIRSALSGTMGRIGGKVARGMMSGVGRDDSSEESYTAADKEEAIVKAFSRVSRHFESSTTEKVRPERREREDRRERGDRRDRGDRGNRRDRPDRSERRRGRDSRGSGSDYQDHMEDNPIENGYEQEILARFLVSIASSDGRITADERELLSELIPSKFGTIEQLQSMDSISRIEAEELDEGIKETIYLLGWSMAIADYDVSPEETRVLLTTGELFGIPDRRKEELAKIAKQECIEQALTNETSRDDLYKLADGIEMDRDDAERCMINFKKKMY